MNSLPVSPPSSISFRAEDGIRDWSVTGVQTCALPISTRKNFLIVPIGFVSDHVEVLYDVDVAYRGLAERLGVRLERTDSLHDDPLLVAALASLARRTPAWRRRARREPSSAPAAAVRRR